MNIQAQKISLAKLILETDNPKILESVRNVFSKAKTQDFWESLSEAEKQEIDKGLAEIVKEEIVSYESVVNKHRK